MTLFDFDNGSSPQSKMYVHMGLLPPYIDPKQPPTKKQPWRAINDAPFMSGVSMVMPAELYATVWDKVETSLKEFQYAKVILKLEHLLQGDFFTEYIKRGMTRSPVLEVSSHPLCTELTAARTFWMLCSVISTQFRTVPRHKSEQS